MTLSTEARAVTYPSLTKTAAAGPDSLAWTHGHSAGYTAGLRRATAEAADRQALMDLEHATQLAEAEERTNRALDALAAAAAALHRAVLPVVTDAQDTLVASALDLAETIIGTELANLQLSSRTALARALDGAPETGAITVAMHPDDLAALPAGAARAGVTFAADASLRPGDAVAEYEHGHVNARVADAVDRARAALLGVPA